jgi:signal transduction histidine kinase
MATKKKFLHLINIQPVQTFTTMRTRLTLYVAVISLGLWNCQNPTEKAIEELKNKTVYQELLYDTMKIAPIFDSLRQQLLESTVGTTEVDLLNKVVQQWAVMAPAKARELSAIIIDYSRIIKYNKGHLEAQNSLGHAYLHSDMNDSAMECYSTVLSNNQINHPIAKARAYLGMANAFRLSRKFKEAIENTNKTILILDSIVAATTKEDSLDTLYEVNMMLGSSYQNLGRTNLAAGNRTEALKYLEKAYAQFELLQATEEVSSVLANLATVYDRGKEIDKAIEMYEQSIKTAQNSRNRFLLATLYNNFGSYLDEKTKFQEALEAFEKGLHLRDSIGDNKGKAATLNNIGIVYKKLGDIALSLQYYEKSLEIKEQLHDVKGAAASLNNIGVIYKSLGDNLRALEYYIKAAHNFEKINDAKGMASAYNNIGILYKHLDDIPKAIEYYKKSLAARESVNDRRGLMAVYINIALIYKSQNDLSLALDYLQKSLEISEEIGDKMGISSAVSNIGTIYHSMGNLKLAQEYIAKSLQIREETNDKQGLAYSLYNMGSIYFDLKQFDKAKNFTEKSYKVSKELVFPKNVESAANLLQKIYLTQGDFKKAYYYLNESVALRDTLASKETKEEAEKMHWKYQYDKKSLADSLQHAKILELKNVELQRKQEVSEKQRTIIVALTAVFVLLVVLIALIYRSFRIKLTSNRIISEKNEMLRQALEEIKATSDELYHKNMILEESQAEIQKQRNELVELNIALQRTNKEIKHQNEELIRTQKQLVLSEKMASVGVLTAGIAHEINNPVNFVYAGVNSALRDFSDISHVLNHIKDIEGQGTQHSELVEKIIQAKNDFEFDNAYTALMQTLGDIKLGAQRIAEIVQGLRDFSRSDKDEFGVADINKVIEIVLTLMKNKYKNRVEIVRDFDQSLPEIVCKPGKLNQVFMNLISNAIDAIEQSGTITIKTGTKGNECYISIKDTGTGIKSSILPKIFDPFYTTKQVGEGTGLGLSISYGIMQEHNGRIEVQSDEGKGSEFTVYLPVIKG